MEDELLPIQLDFAQDTIIKVMGVGGGGGNAINYMYNQGIDGVTYLICNTDRQVLSDSPTSVCEPVISTPSVSPLTRPSIS